MARKYCIFKEFPNVSGLIINIKKTTVVKTNEWRDNLITVCPKLELVWTHESDIVGMMSMTCPKLLKLTLIEIADITYFERQVVWLFWAKLLS